MDYKNRTWYYIQKPNEHDIVCNVCKGINLQWSTIEQHVWCFDCEIDFIPEVYPLAGPLPTYVAEILGISFDRYNMITKQIEKYDSEKNEYIKD